METFVCITLLVLVLYVVAGFIFDMFSTYSEFRKSIKASTSEIIVLWPLILFKLVAHFIKNFDIDRYTMP